MRNIENNFAFIDSQNLNLGVRSLGWQLDFALFRRYLKEKYGVSKAFVFLGVNGHFPVGNFLVSLLDCR